LPPRRSDDPFFELRVGGTARAAPADVRIRLAEGALAWTSAVALLVVALVARLIYSLRRHRVGDYSGRYRVWKWVARGAVAMSFNCVAAIHPLLSASAVAATGWSFSRNGAEWWLAPSALFGIWIFARLRSR